MKKITSGLSSFVGRVKALLGMEADQSDNDKSDALYASLKQKESNLPLDLSVYDGYIVYSIWWDAKMTWTWFRRDFTESDGVFEVSDARVEVKPVFTFAPVVAEAEPKAACACHAIKEIETMKPNTEKVKALIADAGNTFVAADQAFLEGLTDEQLARVETLGKLPAVPVVAEVVTPVVEVVAPVVAEVVKVKTIEEVIAEAPAELRDGLTAGVKVAADKKAESIATLKASGRSSFSEAELAGRTQAELDQLVKLADVKVAVDFSGAGAPKPQVDANTVPTPPVMADVIKAARAKK